MSRTDRFVPILRRALSAVLVGASVLVSTSAGAALIVEVEPNDTLATAQSVDGGFSTGTQAGVIGSNVGWSWVSIRAATGSTYDYYSFSVFSLSNWWFDIDNSADMEFALFDSTGGVVFQQDDGVQDNAGTGLYSNAVDDDSGLYPERSIALNAGSYAIGVCNFNCNAEPGTLNGSPAVSSYTLNISTDESRAGVPAPATLALLGLGLLSLRLRRRA